MTHQKQLVGIARAADSASEDEKDTAEGKFIDIVIKKWYFRNTSKIGKKDRSSEQWIEIKCIFLKWTEIRNCRSWRRKECKFE